jgi:hypothetical protein
MKTSLRRADRHILIVVHERQWLHLGRKLAYLQCFCCDFQMGPLTVGGRASRQW